MTVRFLWNQQVKTCSFTGYGELLAKKQQRRVNTILSGSIVFYFLQYKIGTGRLPCEQLYMNMNMNIAVDKNLFAHTMVLMNTEELNLLALVMSEIWRKSVPGWTCERFYCFLYTRVLMCTCLISNDLEIIGIWNFNLIWNFDLIFWFDFLIWFEILSTHVPLHTTNHDNNMFIKCPPAASRTLTVDFEPIMHAAKFSFFLT